MKESENNMGVGARVGMGVEAVRKYGELLKKRVECEITVKRTQAKADRTIKRGRKTGFEGLDITQVQEKYIDSSDEVSKRLKLYNPEDIDTVDEVIQFLDSSPSLTTENAAVLSRRMELGLERGSLSLDKIREAEKQARSLTIEILRTLLK